MSPVATSPATLATVGRDTVALTIVPCAPAEGAAARGAGLTEVVRAGGAETRVPCVAAPGAEVDADPGAEVLDVAGVFWDGSEPRG